MVDIITVEKKEAFEAASVLFKEYAAWLNIDLSFQHFEDELLQLKQMYAAPEGIILLAKANKHYIGCVAVRKQEEGIAELKRMYVQPQYQQAGLGAALLNAALQVATNNKYKKIRLDTLANMTGAINLYKKAGFYQIPAYYFNPEKNALYFEKLL